MNCKLINNDKFFNFNNLNIHSKFNNIINVVKLYLFNYNY